MTELAELPGPELGLLEDLEADFGHLQEQVDFLQEKVERLEDALRALISDPGSPHAAAEAAAFILGGTG